MDLETSEGDLRSDFDGETRDSRVSLEQQRSLLQKALDCFSWNTHLSNNSIEHQHNQDGCKKTRRKARIRLRICLAIIMLCFSDSKSSAFSLKSLSKRKLQRMPTKTTSSLLQECKELKFLLSVGMTQSNQEESDGNEHQADDSAARRDYEVKQLEKKFKKRISRLEDIVSRQEVEIHRLKQTCAELTDVSEAFRQLMQLLREAGLDAENLDTDKRNKLQQTNETGDSNNDIRTKRKFEIPLEKVIESYDDALVFGTAPSSVIDAADGAGAAILAAMLGGKQRMLIDVRDAELSTDPETLVQFIELAILPIAAGLEGLKSTRNRVKIVFPKVSQLLEYRRTMALAAPEVVALSTLGFDPVEKRDKLVVIVAPEPDDEEGIQAIRDLLIPTEEGTQPIQQPVVILNYHMLPFSGVDLEFETAYHLRLLSVQYMADMNAEEAAEEVGETEASVSLDDNQIGKDPNQDVESEEGNDIEDEALESAMKHAHDIGVNEGVTRAMVIRAYPRPWHIFVDLSPNTNADFEVAATFDKEPTMEELNLAIVECLEGSEREDEIVAQQMQQALEDGQLNQVSGMVSDTLGNYFGDEEDGISLDDDEDDDFDMFEEDSV